ncbi:MAG TPA: radical SAM protein [Candidatus Methylomirabilis sp.]
MGNPLQVREIQARSILNKSGISDFTVNCYLGCQHGCRYCYARFMTRFNPHREAWGDFVDVKVNAPAILERQVKRAPKGRVFISSVCDPYQPLELRYGLTRACLQILLAHGYPITFLTKSALASRDLDLMASSPDLELGVTVTTADEGLSRLIEPGASPTEERLALLEQAKAKGIQIYAFLGPFLPGLSDTDENLSHLIERIARIGVAYCYADILNPRPQVWSSLKGLLENNFPEQVASTGRILYNRRARDLYQEAIREQILRSAQRAGLRGEIHFCF